MAPPRSGPAAGALTLASALALLPGRSAGLGLQCLSDGKHRTRGCVNRTIMEVPRFDHDNTTLRASPMPAAINTILLQEEFESWDLQRADIMQAFMKETLAFPYFAHARDTFGNHLRNTWGILQAWGQPEEICRAGLFHTIYGGDLFIFSTLDPFQASSRERLREVVQEDAEALTWDFGTLSRSLVNSSLHAARHARLEGEMEMTSFLGTGPRNVTARQLAKIMVVTIADYLDQLVEINLWRDFHSYEPPSALYPGTLKPEVALYWLSRVCNGIRDHLDVVPPIFNYCTEEIGYEEEKESRDLYWTVIAEGNNMGDGLKMEILSTAINKNGFIAEPHVYLAELMFKRGTYADCALEARKALDLFYAMSTSWDKRLPFRQWVAHTRMLLLRCVRRSEGKTSMPMTEQGVVLANGLVAEMERVSPLGRPGRAADGGLLGPEVVQVVSEGVAPDEEKVCTTCNEPLP